MATNGMLNRFRHANERLNYLYYGRGSDEQRQFKRLIASRIPDAAVILDLGAGRSDVRRYWEVEGQSVPTNGLIVAVDMAADGLRTNPNPVRLLGDACSLPFPDGSIDLIATQNMFEHLEHPEKILREVGRVLKKGGALVFSTPRRSSYISFVASMTPMAIHRGVLKIRGFGANNHDCCETLYRLNELKTIKRVAERANLTLDEYTTHVGDPCYTTFLPPPMHCLFIVLHKLMERTAFTRRRFGLSLVGVLKKV